jgi:hypothetical protein
LAPAAPDRFAYTVRHGDREVHVGEGALSPGGKQLLQWIMRNGSPG